ncbi:MAG: Zn-dependent hydrolase, partial [Xanthomonadales bacterium]|nr:Zn-dependent hydrolase [Xanthomonadales bacterium]
MSRLSCLLCSLAAPLLLAGCHAVSTNPEAAPEASAAVAPPSAGVMATRPSDYVTEHLKDYASVTLDADLSALDAKQKQMLVVLIKAADVMNEIYWKQAWGDRDALMARVHDRPTWRFLDINYGPWDRLNNNHPFIDGVGPRPPGARFYPTNMTKAEFERAPLKDKTSLYTLLRRDDAGALVTIPYHQAYRSDLQKAAGLLHQAARLAEDKGFANYLSLRAQALLNDNYRPSDFAWMEMKTNPIDIVIGPIETYEDQVFGYKASYEAYVLLKDTRWSAKLQRFAQYLPELQRALPVAAKYKAETPGSVADLNA